MHTCEITKIYINTFPWTIFKETSTSTTYWNVIFQKHFLVSDDPKFSSIVLKTIWRQKVKTFLILLILLGIIKRNSIKACSIKNFNAKLSLTEKNIWNIWVTKKVLSVWIRVIITDSIIVVKIVILDCWRKMQTLKEKALKSSKTVVTLRYVFWKNFQKLKNEQSVIGEHLFDMEKFKICTLIFWNWNHLFLKIQARKKDSISEKWNIILWVIIKCSILSNYWTSDTC